MGGVSTIATTTGLEAGAAGAADAVVEAFVWAIGEAEDAPWRQARLLAYVRLRKSEMLVRLAKKLVWREETKWHSMEILKRNPEVAGELPDVEGWERLEIEPKSGMCVVWVPPGEFWMGRTHGVGLLRPNGRGMYDMHGNVWELCGDVWDGKAYGKRESGWKAREWTEEDAGEEAEYWWGRDEGAIRVDRGGSWYNNAAFCRSAYRNRNPPGDRFFSLGFRIVFPEAGSGSTGALQ